VAAGALGFASGTIWSVHATRKWVFWQSTVVYVGAITLAQVAFISSMNMNSTINVVLLGFVVNAVALLHQGFVAWLGFTCGVNQTPQSRSASQECPASQSGKH
jgi:hypothetical protein